MRQGVATKQGVYALYTTYLAVRKAIADKQLNTANVPLVNEYMSNMTHVMGSLSPRLMADELIYDALWLNPTTAYNSDERMRAVAWLIVADHGKEHAAYLFNLLNGTSWPLEKLVAAAKAILAFKQSPEQTPASVQEPAPEQPTATSRWQGATPPSKNDVVGISDASVNTTPDELSNESPESSDWLSDFSDGLDRENRNRFSKSPS